jgi:hypothetical protein
MPEVNRTIIFRKAASGASSQYISLDFPLRRSVIGATMAAYDGTNLR